MAISVGAGGRKIASSMAQKISYALLSLRALLVSAGPFILLALALLTLAYWWLDPNPPKQVTLATGPAQSAYSEFGSRYAKALALNGIEVRLIPSEGSSANLQLLREGKADLGFVQGGSDENPLNPPLKAVLNRWVVCLSSRCGCSTKPRPPLMPPPTTR